MRWSFFFIFLQFFFFAFFIVTRTIRRLRAAKPDGQEHTFPETASSPSALTSTKAHRCWHGCLWQRKVIGKSIDVFGPGLRSAPVGAKRAPPALSTLSQID